VRPISVTVRAGENVAVIENASSSEKSADAGFGERRRGSQVTAVFDAALAMAGLKSCFHDLGRVGFEEQAASDAAAATNDATFSMHDIAMRRAR
jgi:hypothetical protein